jgi:hypothetical protein
MYAIWSSTSVDSYTMEAFRKEGSLIHIEHHIAKGYQARLLSVGQLATIEPELRSEWFVSSQEARMDVVSKALQFYRSLGLLTEDNKPNVLSMAEISKTGVVEQLRPSVLKPLIGDSYVVTAHEDCGIPWTEMREGSPYCYLCEAWANKEHL